VGIVPMIDEDAPWESRAGQLAHVAALVEQILEDFVGLELDRVWLVDRPPEQLLALAAGHEPGLRESA
jgi:hypothetical protein